MIRVDSNKLIFYFTLNRTRKIKEFVTFPDFAWLSFLPSHTHITSLKPLYTGRLRYVRENESPSRYPHILGHIHSHYIVTGQIRECSKRKSEGDVRENKYPSRALSPLYIGIWEGSCEYVRDIFEFLNFSRPIQREIKNKFIRVNSYH